MLTAALKNAPPQQKSEYFAGLARSTAGDREAYTAIMRQLAPDDPVTAIAGLYAAGKTPERRAAGERMIRGQAILNPPRKEDGKPVGGKLIDMPPDQKLLSEFAAQTEKVFAGKPQASADAFQAARTIYAAYSSDEGDNKGELNSTRWKKSINEAVGQIETYQGKPIILPENFDMWRFRDAIAHQARVLVASKRLDKSITIDKLRDMPLENVGDGRYVFRAGDGVLSDFKNQPVIINLNRSELP